MSYSATIIIPVFNNWKYTEKCLQYLYKLGDDYQIIIVNNGSKDKTASILKTMQQELFNDNLVVINSEKNLGFSRGNNLGYQYAEGEVVIFLNNDIEVTGSFEHWPDPLIIEAKKGKIVCTKGGQLDKNFDFVREGCGLVRDKYWYMSGWCIAAQKTTFDQLIQNHCYDINSDKIVNKKATGPWNEKFFLYYEDGDLTWRAQGLNIPITEISMTNVRHIGRATGKRYNAFVFLKKSKRIFDKIWKGR